MVHSMVKNMLKNFGGMKIMSTFASQTQKTAHLPTAKIAQLVEHDLAKVGVAGSSPVFRSSFINRTIDSYRGNKCPDGGIGRRATLRG